LSRRRAPWATSGRGQSRGGAGWSNAQARARLRVCCTHVVRDGTGRVSGFTGTSCRLSRALLAAASAGHVGPLGPHERLGQTCGPNALQERTEGSQGLLSRGRDPRTHGTQDAGELPRQLMTNPGIPGFRDPESGTDRVSGHAEQSGGRLPATWARAAGPSGRASPRERVAGVPRGPPGAQRPRGPGRARPRAPDAGAPARAARCSPRGGCKLLAARQTPGRGAAPAARVIRVFIIHLGLPWGAAGAMDHGNPWEVGLVGVIWVSEGAQRLSSCLCRPFLWRSPATPSRKKGMHMQKVEQPKRAEDYQVSYDYHDRLPLPRFPKRRRASSGGGGGGGR
jgi:hypothetical protein